MQLTAKKPSYIPRFVYDARKPSAIIDYSFCPTRLVHLRCAPTLFMTFARSSRQNRQNLSKLSIIRWILREHMLLRENVQYTDELIAAWHCWLGQLHQTTPIHNSNPTEISVQNKWQKTVRTLLANMGTEYATRGRTSIRLTSVPSPLVTYHSDWFMPNFL